MAGVLATHVVASRSLTAATTETISQLVAAANHCIKLLGFTASFNGTSNTQEPVRIEITRNGTAALGTRSSGTPVEKTITGTTIQTAPFATFTAEPTTNSIVWAVRIHPQSGVVYDYPFDEAFQVAGGNAIALRAITPSGVNPAMTVTMNFEE